MTEEEAAAEARRRNTEERSLHHFWLEVEGPDGQWRVERRVPEDVPTRVAVAEAAKAILRRPWRWWWDS